MEISRELKLFEEATQHEIHTMSDQDIEKMKADLTNDRRALQDQSDEIKRLLSMITIRDRVKRAGRAA